MLDARELTDLLGGYRKTLFRLETLPAYEVATDGSDYRRWLDGEPEPTWERKQPWLDQLARETGEGRSRWRVRMLHQPITPYERYACEWGYALNTQAGERIQIIDRPVGLAAYGDFWIVDDQQVVLMHYAATGEYRGATVLPAANLPAYQKVRGQAWEMSVPFEQWWAQHPEHRRAARAA